MTPSADIHIYTIEVANALNDDFLHSFCPDGTTLAYDGKLTILANVQTDQSGILGLMRALHNLNFTIIKMLIN